MIASRLQALCHRLQARLRGAGLGTRRDVDEGVGRHRSMKMPSDLRFGLLFPSLDRGALCKDPAGGYKERTELKQSTMKRRSSDAGLQA
jgi:hypothetical protein